MKTKILLLMGLSLLVTVTEAQPSTRDRDSLKGLRGFSVLVAMSGPNLEKDGVTRDQLQTRVEVKLRQAGIKIIPSPELPGIPGPPVLFVSVNVLRMKPAPSYSWSIELSMIERVILDRDRNKMIDGMTWHDSWYGYAGIERTRTILDSVSDAVEVFINDYLAANAK